MKKISTAVLMAYVLLYGAGSMAQTVKVNWQDRAPFADYRTFAWRPSKNQGPHFYRQWVGKDVNAALAQKGLVEVKADQNPDLYVYYHVVSEEVMDSTTTDDGFGWGPGGWDSWGGWGGLGGWGGWGPDIAQTEQEPRMMGILSVDLVDVRKKELVWRGQATVDSISNTQKGDKKQVLKSIGKMFKQFPPKEKRAG